MARLTFLQRSEKLRIHLEKTQQTTLLQKLTKQLRIITQNNFQFDCIDQAVVNDIITRMK